METWLIQGCFKCICKISFGCIGNPSIVLIPWLMGQSMVSLFIVCGKRDLQGDCVCLKLKLVLKSNWSSALGRCPVLTVSSLFSPGSLIKSSGLLTFAFSHYRQIGSCNQTGPVGELLLNKGSCRASSLKAMHSWRILCDNVKQQLQNSSIANSTDICLLMQKIHYRYTVYNSYETFQHFKKIVRTQCTCFQIYFFRISSLVFGEDF